MNQVILIGRITANPDLKFLQSGIALSRFNIAIDRSYKKNNETVTDFIPVEVWGKKAEYCATYITKGTLIAVNGSLHYDRYSSPEGEMKTFTKVVANTVTKLSTPSAASQSVEALSDGAEINEVEKFIDTGDKDIPF